MFRKIFIIIVFLIGISVNGYSQDSVSVSKGELKTLCLILNEHEKLSNENPLLKQQITSLEQLNQLYVKSDSIQKIEIETYEDKVANDTKQIQRLKSAQKKTLFSASVGGIVLFILGLLL